MHLIVSLLAQNTTINGSSVVVVDGVVVCAVLVGCIVDGGVVVGVVGGVVVGSNR